jgi:hypothetical protein
LSVLLNHYQLRLERYERDLRDFEDRYGMDMPTFYKRFEVGELGDNVRIVLPP